MHHDLETELLQDTALFELETLVSPLKKELDQITLEKVDRLIPAFRKLGTKPDEILFLQSLIALKLTQKNLEKHHHFNRQVAPLSGTSVKE